MRPPSTPRTTGSPPTTTGASRCIRCMREPSGERRPDVIEFLKFAYRVEEVTDYSGLELDGIHLRAPAMVLDHVPDRIHGAVATGRPQAAAPVLHGIRPRADDVRRPRREGTPVYHTNVMMCVATDFAPRPSGRDRRREAPQRGRRTAARDGKTVVALTQAQVRAFAGNAIEPKAARRRGGCWPSTTAADHQVGSSERRDSAGAGCFTHRTGRRIDTLHDCGHSSRPRTDPVPHPHRVQPPTTS